MLASLALLSACNKESNEPAVQQEQKAKSGVSISMSGQIELPGELARGLEFHPYDKNGRTSYTPFFNGTDIPALVCFYNDEPDASSEDAPYVMRQIVLGINNTPGPDGRMVSSFYFKQDQIDPNQKLFQDHLKPHARRDKAKVYTDPETLRMTLVVGFEVRGGNVSAWDSQPMYTSRTRYTLPTDLDLTKPIDYWVAQGAKTGITRPIFIASEVKPTGVVDGKIVFSNVKLRMLGTIIKARIRNNDGDSHVIKGMKIDKVGRGDLVFEHPTRVEIPGTRKKKLVPPTIATDAGSSEYTDRYINLLFTTRKTIDPFDEKEWLIYLPLYKTESGGRLEGPVFSVLYDGKPGSTETGTIQKLKPLKRDGLIVSHTFNIKR